MKFKAVLFDLDNTLIDFMSMKQRCCEAAAEAMVSAGLKMKKEEVLELMFEVYKEKGIEYQNIFQELLQRIHGKIDYKILSAGIVAYRKAQNGLIKPYPKTVPTLIELKKRGLKLAIVSDAPALKAWIRLTELGIVDFFDAVVTPDNESERKPSPLPFKKALEKLKIKPEEALMVGDWPERDILGAKSIGISTCLAKYGYHLDEPLDESSADYVINDIEELLKITRTWIVF